jgi:hypothetical protein
MKITISIFFLISLIQCNNENSKPNIKKKIITNSLIPVIPFDSRMTLNDIAIECFDHPRVDSSIRIWYWEHTPIDSGGNYKINLLEFGFIQNPASPSTLSYRDSLQTKQYYAMFRVCEIEAKGEIDNFWDVKSLSTKYLKPKNGWVYFNNQIKSQNLDKIYLIANEQQSGSPSSSFSHLSLQFVFRDRFEVLDFTSQYTIYKSSYPRDTSFVNLMKLVNDEFGLNIHPNY